MKISSIYQLVLPFLLVVGAAFFYWAVVATSYTFTYYRIPECDKAFTVMEISDPSKRQVAFISGEYHEHHLPSKDYVLRNLESGFDAYFNCIPTCDTTGRIVVNYYDGSFIQAELSGSITVNKVSSEEYGMLLMRAVYHPEVRIY